MENERLKKQLEFCREIDKEKFIGRQTYLTDGERKENDAEHAWHMAIMTVLLAEYANEKIDAHIKSIRKVLKEFQEYKLITVRGKGYYLRIP